MMGEPSEVYESGPWWIYALPTWMRAVVALGLVGTGDQ